MEDDSIKKSQQKRIQEMNDSDLLKVIEMRKEYQPDFANFAIEEAIKRNLIEKDFEINSSNQTNDSKTSDTPNQKDFQPQEYWYYEYKGKRIGPIPETDISNLIDSEKISKQSVVWKKGFQDWKIISETELIKYFEKNLNEPPPLASHKINNTFIWILAFIPLIGATIEIILSLNDNELSTRSTWILYFILNSGFAVLDDIKLKHAGYTTNNLGWAIFFIPVYIWRRARLTKQRKYYFWTWIACFLTPIIIGLIANALIEISNQTSNQTSDNTSLTEQNTTQNQSVFNFGDEVIFSDINSNELYSITTMDFIDNYMSGIYTDNQHKLVAVEISFKNKSLNPIDYNATNFSLIDENGYAFDTDLELLVDGKNPQFGYGSLSKGSFVRGWITIKTLKSSNVFKLHFYDMFNNAVCDINLNKK